MVKSELGGALLAMRRYAEAEDLLSACLPVLTERLGGDHPATRRTRERLVRLYLETGRDPRAARERAAPDR